MRILVVEDDVELRSHLEQRLQQIGYGVDTAADGEAALFAGLHYPIDAAVVDLGLPKLDGLEVIRQWRRQERVFPVMILTARDRWQDRIAGLDTGADDYIGKTANTEEILARLRALIRRSHGWGASEIICGPYALDTRLRRLMVHGAEVDLTTFEYRLLEHLMLCTEQTLSVNELEEHLYSEQAQHDSNLVAQFIFRLRRKLDPQGVLCPIETVKGDGYRFTISRGSAATISLRRPKLKS